MQYSKGIYLEVEQKEVVKGIMDKYGKSNQLAVVLEEAGELLSAFIDEAVVMNQHLVLRNQCAVLDEIADCYITMEHMQNIIGWHVGEIDIAHRMEKINGMDGSDIISIRHERKTCKIIGEAIQCFARVARYIDDEAIPSSHKIKCQMHINNMLYVAAYIQRYMYIKDEWVKNRIASKIERMSMWLKEDVTFHNTTEVRDVRDSKEDIDV